MIHVAGKQNEALVAVVAEDTAMLSRALDSIHEFLDTTPDDTVWDGSEVKAMMRVLSKILRGVHVEDACLGRVSVDTRAPALEIDVIQRGASASADTGRDGGRSIVLRAQCSHWPGQTECHWCDLGKSDHTDTREPAVTPEDVSRARQEIERAYAEFKPQLWVSGQDGEAVHDEPCELPPFEGVTRVFQDGEATSGLECPRCRGACVIAGDGEEEPCDLCDCTGVIRR